MLRALLALALSLLPGVAHADWYEASTTHFVVYSDDKPEVIKLFAERLERFDKAMRFLRNLADEPVGKANRVVVYVVADIATVGRLHGDRAAAGFYTPRAGESAAFVPRDTGEAETPEEYREMAITPLQILLHEYTHHFLLSLSPNTAYPAWFVEGYAEFFAASEFGADGSVIVGRPPQYRSWDMFGENPLPVAKMLTLDPTTLSSDQRYALYARGWLLTHYLFLGGKRDGQLGAYFRALGEGQPPAEAAKVFGDLKKLDAELWRYKRGDFAGMRIAASVLPIGEVAVRKLGAGEAATMRVRVRSKAGVTPQQAGDVYAAAKAACAPYPNDPLAQVVLAEAAYDAGDYAGAEAAADRALAADANSVDALLYKARARMEVARKANDRSPAAWTAIRRLISTANRIDLADPRVLRLFYESYPAAGQVPPKLAREGLYYAYLLAPQDKGLRFETAIVYLQDGQAPIARAMLQTLALDPHDPARAALAARMVAAIDSGHPEAAIAELEKQD